MIQLRILSSPFEDSDGNVGFGSCATKNDSEESVKKCFEILNSFSLS
ncbi:MAG: hypothetical protein Ct9H90mP13_05490 [Pseudomonadota bacterium]|nr:MAG: hypothetical protein Ct9H90mP13_05490 [Pseudomonadota bacterium]